MAENDFFVEEVSADLRKEGMSKYFHKYRFVLVGIVVGVIALVAINEFRGAKIDKSRAAEFAALTALQNGQASEGDRALLENTSTEVVALEMARQKRDAGDIEGAKAAYQAIIDAGYSKTSQSLAELALASLTEGADFGVLQNPNAPFRLEAKILEINSLLGSGEEEKAKEALVAILNDQDMQSAHGLAERLFLALGGDLNTLGGDTNGDEQNDETTQ